MTTTSSNLDKHLILLGTHDVYIHTVEFDSVARTLKPVARTRMSQDPSWLTRHPSIPNIIYANGHVDGKVYCLQVDPVGGLTVLDEAVSGGKGPTHLAVSKERDALLIAHYGQAAGGTLASLPLERATGRFAATSTSANHSFVPPYTPSSHPRLDAPHVHQVLVHEEEVITCDLGNNRLWRLVKKDDGWDVKGAIEDFEPADGPRHAVIHPNGESAALDKVKDWTGLIPGGYIYVLNEVSSTLSVHTLPPSGPSQLLCRHSLLPPADRSNSEMTAAGIALYPPLSTGGESLLVLTNRYSTRPEGDALALFAVSDDGSVVRPAPKALHHGIGKHIRALGADPTGKWIVTAGRDQGGVVVLERVGDGLELEEVARVDLPHVVVPLWL